MTRKSKSPILDVFRQSKGAVAVEFALIATVFFLLVAGVIDFGHAYYMKQTITNASREGARYGVTYARNSAATVRVAAQYFHSYHLELMLHLGAKRR